MTTATVTILDDERAIRDGEAAVRRYDAARNDARKQIMPMALGLLAARRQYPADQAFGAWRKASPYGDLGDDDRAALINIGKHPRLAEVFLRTTNLISPESIWDALKAMLAVSEDPKPTDQDSETSEIDPQPRTTPSEPVSTSAEAEKSDEHQTFPVIGGSEAMKDLNKADLVTLLDISTEMFAEVLSAYPSNRQRAIKAEFAKLANKKGHKKKAVELWKIAHDVAIGGRVVKLSNTYKFDARIILPDVPEGFCQTFTLATLAEKIEVLPLLNAKAVELAGAGEAPFKIREELDHLWATGKPLQRQTKTRKVELPPEDSKNRIKHEVTFCGETIWPSDSLKHVTYDDLNTGWHLIHYWVAHLETATPQKPREIATKLRHLMHDIAQAKSIASLADVMSACLQAYSRKNEQLAQADMTNCKPPGLGR